MSVVRKSIAGAAAAASVYGCWIRPRLKRLGATPGEVAELPGGDLISEAKPSPALAATINAAPEQVWPWLVQLGWDRGGWYSWDFLDNGGRRSATAVHPEWQDLAVGDKLKFKVFGKVADAYRVAVIEPNSFLGLYGLSDLFGRWLDPQRPRPSFYMEAIWSFHLRPLPDGRTRLVVGGYQLYRPRWLERFYADWVILPMSSIMSTRMLKILKRNIERASGAAASTMTDHADSPIRSERRSATA